MTLHFNIPFLLGQICSKCFKSSSGRSLSIGMQYLRSSSVNYNYGHQEEEIQTISRAIYLSIASPVTCDGQNFGQSRAPLYCHLQIHGSREKRNRNGSWSSVRARCHARHAIQAGSLRSAVTKEYTPGLPPGWNRVVESGEMMRSEDLKWTRTYQSAYSLWINAIYLWTVGCVADSLENWCLPRVRSSNDEDSKLDIGGYSGEILLRIHSTSRQHFARRYCTAIVPRHRIAPGRRITSRRFAMYPDLSRSLIKILASGWRVAKPLHTRVGEIAMWREIDPELMNLCVHWLHQENYIWVFTSFHVFLRLFAPYCRYKTR